MSVLDRLQTIAVTATLTSAAWIVAGTIYLNREPAGEAPAPAHAEQVVAGQAAADPMPVREGSLTIPVLGVAPGQLRGSFGDARGDRRHEAIDIAASTGTPVIAAAPGVVEKLFQSDAGGNTIYIRSTDRQTLYYYAHLHAYEPGLAEGQNVTPGQRLGTVGFSGNADPAAPHLHFAVLRTESDAQWWEPATAIDPFPLLRRS